MLQTKYFTNKKVLSQDVGYYTPILTRVREARQRFHKWADTLPEEVRQTVSRMCQGNQETLPGSLVGERDAFWLGECVNASEESQLIAALGSITGYGYFLHQDDVVDGEASTVRRTELARNFLYAKLLESFQKITPSNDSFWDYWNQYLKEYTKGLLFEDVETKIPRPYSRNDDNLIFVAARSAPVKICASSLALSSGKYQEIPRIEKGIEQLTIGLQFRDDLTDCLEDFLRGNYTPVVNRLIGTGQPSLVVLKKAALYTNAIEELLDESTWWLRKASETLGLCAEISLQKYIEHLSTQNDFIKFQVRHVKGGMSLPEESSNPKTYLSIQEAYFWDKIYEVIQPRLEY